MKISEQLYWADLALDTALNDPAILSELAKWNLEEEQLRAGQALLQRAQMLTATQRKELGDRYHATDAFQAVRDEARTLYHKHLADARHALREQRGYWKALELNGARKADLLGWLAQAQTFYSNISPVMPILKKYNVTDAEVAKGKALIEKVMEAYHARSREANEAVMATQSRNLALKNLDDWMKRFTLTVRLAFADQPHYLDRLGITKKKTA